ncbi:hypothetical protein AJ78_05618 [Emergomyces pasteurianus Ep9510]|uniref:Uncharacterized protein n=1 Tax=Emergomyces pasteurianus Ep9510 TaxID=1447872 RepID=A0A1J9QFP5_9EURO|nr:hypothetical protein AJ78_05618 [Emergomyces pasteurianus Ep9510]
MGLVDMFTDLISSLPFAEAQAEAPPTEEAESTAVETQADDAEKEEEPEEEEEEEEEEVEDIKPKLEEGRKRASFVFSRKRDWSSNPVGTNAPIPPNAHPQSTILTNVLSESQETAKIPISRVPTRTALRSSSTFNIAQPNAQPPSSSELSNKDPVLYHPKAPRFRSCTALPTAPFQLATTPAYLGWTIEYTVARELSAIRRDGAYSSDH